MLKVLLPASMLQPWGSKCIFTNRPTAFKLYFASNIEAMTYWCSCWIEQSSSSRATQSFILMLARLVFTNLDWGALRLKQMFAAEVKRLESLNLDKGMRKRVSRILCDFPEICELWLHSIWLRSPRALSAGWWASRDDPEPPIWTRSGCRNDLIDMILKGMWLTGLRHEKCLSCWHSDFRAVWQTRETSWCNFPNHSWTFVKPFWKFQQCSRQLILDGFHTLFRRCKSLQTLTVLFETRFVPWSATWRNPWLTFHQFVKWRREMPLGFESWKTHGCLPLWVTRRRYSDILFSELLRPCHGPENSS